MNITVFYAWQADRPGKYNRYLIRDAAKEACRRITDDPLNDYVVSLDEATLGAPGMCDVPNTILEKIQACHVFLADLTFVGRTDGENEDELQLISNPNVLFELGYAVKAKGFDRILGVMNAAYGEPERQMFDVKRRWAITYNLLESVGKSEIQAAKKQLSREIEQSLLTILDKAVSPEERDKAWERFRRIRAEFESSVRHGSFHGLDRKSGAIAITLVPDAVQSYDHSKLQLMPLLPPIRKDSGREHRGKSIVSVYEADRPRDTRGQSVRCSVAEITVEGVVFAADTYYLDPAMHFRSAEVGNMIPSQVFEQVVVDSLVSYSDILRQVAAPLPWRVGVSLVGIRGYRMYSDGYDRSHIIDHADDICADPVVVHDLQQTSDQATASRLLKDAFDYISRECGLPHSLNYDAEGDWKGPFLWR